jgi:hypothetical protein
MCRLGASGISVLWTGCSASSRGGFRIQGNGALLGKARCFEPAHWGWLDRDVLAACAVCCSVPGVVCVGLCVVFVFVVFVCLFCSVSLSILPA